MPSQVMALVCLQGERHRFASWKATAFKNFISKVELLYRRVSVQVHFFFAPRSRANCRNHVDLLTFNHFFSPKWMPCCPYLWPILRYILFLQVHPFQIMGENLYSLHCASIFLNSHKTAHFLIFIPSSWPVFPDGPPRSNKMACFADVNIHAWMSSYFSNENIFPNWEWKSLCHQCYFC